MYANVSNNLHTVLSIIKADVLNVNLHITRFAPEPFICTGCIHVNPEISFGGTNREPPSEVSQLRKGGPGVLPRKI